MSATRESGARRVAQQIIDRATSDVEFRSRLMKDPRGAIQQEFSLVVPESVTLRVIEEKPGEVVLVLPGRAVQSSSFLSDEELDKAAGGVVENTISMGEVGVMCVC